MSQHVDAIFDSGILHLLTPLALPDKTVVKLIVDSPGDVGPTVEPQDEWERSLLGIGEDCGVSLPDSAVGSDELYE
jgi:hypothetical protein